MMPAPGFRAVLRCSLSVCFLAGSVPAMLQAQALPTASGGGSYIAVGAGVSAVQSDYGHRVLGGGTVYVDANATWRLGFEGEARFLRFHTDESVNESTYLGGVRFAFRNKRMQPYAKVLVGVGEISLPFQYASGSYLVIAPGAGVDFHINNKWTVRAVDVEYQDWPAFSYGALHPYGVSAGISYRLNPVVLFPKKSAYRH